MPDRSAASNTICNVYIMLFVRHDTTFEKLSYQLLDIQMENFDMIREMAYLIFNQVILNCYHHALHTY
jgi:hypothetical protein